MRLQVVTLGGGPCLQLGSELSHLAFVFGMVDKVVQFIWILVPNSESRSWPVRRAVPMDRGNSTSTIRTVTWSNCFRRVRLGANSNCRNRRFEVATTQASNSLRGPIWLSPGSISETSPPGGWRRSCCRPRDRAGRARGGPGPHPPGPAARRAQRVAGGRSSGRFDRVGPGRRPAPP